MARIGQVLEHPSTGERLEFVETAQSTGGERLVMRFTVAPGAAPAAPHVHPIQREAFDVVSGEIEVTARARVRRIGPGQRGEVPPGVPHTWRNIGRDDAVMDVAFAPALQLERFFEVSFGLANAGKVNAMNMPRPLQIVALGRQFHREVLFVRPPAAVQRLAFRLLGPLAAWRGYQAVPDFLELDGGDQ